MLLRTQGVIVLLLHQVIVWNAVLCQDNTGNRIANDLLECYNTSAIPGIIYANERPPSSLNLLIEYIRKLEDANPTMNARQLSVQLIQRLRQDGITWANVEIDTRIGLPFTASRLEIHKFRAIARELFATPEQSLQYGDLTPIEKCSLHYMISNTIDDFRRPNEASECSRSARYTSRFRRDLEGTNPDAEPIPNISGTSGNLAQINSNTSQCPIELGVTYSQFGAIKTGDVLGGIAAGLNPQTTTSGVDNRYGATLVGELSEAALYQAPNAVSLGASGGWNSTINPRYFFLQSNNNLQATDSELRGALDGLYMALRMTTWTSQFSDLKISQILDMYYSPFEKGVLDESMKACNRNILYTEIVDQTVLNDQVRFFMPLINTAAISQLTLVSLSYSQLANSAVNAIQLYLPRLATSDFSCTGNQFITRVASDVHIFIDSSWSFTTIQPLLSYLLNGIDVNKFGTRYTLYGGSSLINIVNQTNYLSNFHIQYNQSVHTNEITGFDYIRIYETIEQIGRQKLNNNTYSGGESTIFLLVTRTGLNSEQQSFLSGRRSVIDGFLPYINVQVIGTGSQSDYSSVVSNTERDVLIIQDTANEEQLKTFGQEIVSTIQSVPRAIVNPNCGADYSGGQSSFTVTQYVELQGANYYRISPHYFFSDGTKTLRIREQGYGSLHICLSRDNSRPDNQTGVCSTISNAEYTVDISTYCEDSSVTSCSPIFLSIAGVTSNTRCQDSLCRFPNDIKCTITMDNVGCTGGSIAYTASAILIIFLSIFSFL